MSPGSPLTPSLDLDKQLCFAVYRVNHAIQRSYQQELAPLGLTYPQYITLLALWGQDHPVPMKDLCAQLGLDSGTLTPLLRRLADRGLITRTIDPADERRRIIALTDAGRALKTRAAAIPARQCQRFVATGLDLPALKETIDQLTEALAAVS